MKKSLIVIISFSFLLSFSQKKDKNQKMIKNFVNDLYNENISENQIVEKYLLKLKYDKKYSISLEERKKNQILHIQQIRKSKDSIGDNWLMPNSKNANPSHIVEKYNCNKDLDNFFKRKFNRKIKKRMYVLINKEKDSIYQYFLLKKGEIESYTLFIKSNDALFFEY